MFWLIHRKVLIDRIAERAIGRKTHVIELDFVKTAAERIACKQGGVAPNLPLRRINPRNAAPRLPHASPLRAERKFPTLLRQGGILEHRQARNRPNVATGSISEDRPPV